jgi:hypothetical protein
MAASGRATSAAVAVAIPRFLMTLMASFALIALVLTAVGRIWRAVLHRRATPPRDRRADRALGAAGARWSVS